MTTAQEIEIKAAEAAMMIHGFVGRLDTMRKDLTTYGMHVAIGRHVCARRARKLRKRGEEVRYLGRTTTGKARYTWMKRLPPWAIFAPNPTP
jgi:hypothetical protein